jgi:Domain of unknown function (DUF4386)
MNRFRKTAAGLCLIGAPATLFAGTVVHPGLRESAAAQLALIADNPDQWYLNHILGVVSMTLFIPALVALVHLVRDREPGLAYAGAALGVVGTIGFTGVMAIYGFVAWQIAMSPDQARMAELFERINEAPGVAIPFRLMPLAFVAGMVCLAIGLHRAGVARRACVAIAAGPVIFALGAQTENVTLMVPGAGMMTVGLGSIGVRMLKEAKETKNQRRLQCHSSTSPTRRVLSPTQLEPRP